MSSALLQARDLSKVYTTGGGARVRALGGVDLEVASGELTVLMGSSGSGKSTLLYLLSGLERASGGEIRFAGSRIDELDESELSLLRRRGIGFVFQAILLVPHLTLHENVAVPGYLGSGDHRAVDRRARALLERFGVGELAERLPAEVSGGEQQRAALARALINAPRAVLADEPTGALNSAAGRGVLEALRAIADGETRANDEPARRRGVVMATHDPRGASYGDRILYLHDGEVRAEHRPEPRAPLAEREAAVLAWLAERGW